MFYFRVCDSKMNIIQTIGDLLRGELFSIQLVQDACPESSDGAKVAVDFDPVPVVTNCVVDQNGDLAEADQGRVDNDDDDDEEGAVGGFWELQLEPPAVGYFCSFDV